MEYLIPINIITPESIKEENPKKSLILFRVINIKMDLSIIDTPTQETTQLFFKK